MKKSRKILEKFPLCAKCKIDWFRKNSPKFNKIIFINENIIMPSKKPKIEPKNLFSRFIFLFFLHFFIIFLIILNPIKIVRKITTNEIVFKIKFVRPFPKI